MFVRVLKGVVVEELVVIPHANENITGLDTMSVAELADIGYLPLVDDSPVLADDEYYTDTTYVVGKDSVQKKRTVVKFTYEELLAKCRTKRMGEYPNAAEFLDGLVKRESSDAALSLEGAKQVQEYVAMCLAVKQKYPKPVKPSTDSEEA